MIYNLCAVGDDEIDRKKLFIYNKVKDFLREKNEIIFEVGFTNNFLNANCLY